MPELIALSPCAGLDLPETPGCALTEWLPGPITSVTPFRGATGKVTKALKPLGLSFPAPNRMTEKGGVRIAFAGRGAAFLIGAPAPEALREAAALTDQSDGWAVLRLSGAQAEAVLARLIALDLRAASFPPGSAVRAQLNHMPLLLMRPDAGNFDLLTFRSMTRSAVHEIAAAMRMLAARDSLPLSP